MIQLGLPMGIFGTSSFFRCFSAMD